MIEVGERIEVLAEWPYYIHEDVKDQNWKLFIRVVGCRGIVTKSIRTWDGVPYIYVDMDLSSGDYCFGPDWCRELTPLEQLAEQAE